ncbi:MAG TPA: hypothetical protein VH186_07150 [Chloroflexia bacterium]|nr:hypothetical protein [Chloroflexia bacterium]
MRFSSVDRKAMVTGLVVAGTLTVLIIVGSRGFLHFDSALLGYAVSTVFAVLGITYRYVIWLNRPATKLYWKRGWQLFWNRQNFKKHKGLIPFTIFHNIFLQTFILKRGFWRWFMHFNIFWGCVLAACVTFPLVFGWMTFQLETPDMYRVELFGFSTFVTMAVRSWTAWLVFHALDISAVMCLMGLSIAIGRRLKNLELLAIQRFSFDFVPLFLLLLISVTGLMLTGTDLYLEGRFHSAISLIHQAIVIMGILYLPFGKFFHIVERPAAIGIELYQKVAEAEAQHECKRCGEKFTSAMHMADIKTTLQEQGFKFTLPQAPEAANAAADSGSVSGEEVHLQDYCPRCKRVMRGMAYANLAGKKWV